MIRRELTNKEIKEFCKLVKAECCNCNDENCILLDDGEEHVCPQLISRHLCCRWFEKAVMPLEPILLSSFSTEDVGVIKKCVACGTEMIAADSRKKYCDACAKVRLRKQKSSHMARKRGSVVEKIDAKKP